MCLFDEFTDEYIAGTDVEDCGDVEASLEFDEARYAAVRPCVVAANLEQRPFVVRWDFQAIEGVERRAYAGLLINGSWEVSRIVRFTQGTGRRPPMTRSLCTRFEERPDPCMSVGGDLCFRCIVDEPAASCAAAD